MIVFRCTSASARLVSNADVSSSRSPWCPRRHAGRGRRRRRTGGRWRGQQGGDGSSVGSLGAAWRRRWPGSPVTSVIGVQPPCGAGRSPGASGRPAAARHGPSACRRTAGGERVGGLLHVLDRRAVGPRPAPPARCAPRRRYLRSHPTGAVRQRRGIRADSSSSATTTSTRSVARIDTRSMSSSAVSGSNRMAPLTMITVSPMVSTLGVSRAPRMSSTASRSRPEQVGRPGDRR